ncbi:MAG: hypothetical protein A2X36_08755 [Elusimicrobia bacterium GWA2_69_24]|nr:MAG: hypothetical protein A2X36_08755 [Elusimicrobia bacterium GWA2_69_24]
MLVLCGALPGLLRATVEPPKLSLIDRREEIIRSARERIQSEILDRVLGPGKASVFVDLEMTFRATRKDDMKAGAGSAEKYKAKGAGLAALQTQYILPGIPKPKNLVGPEEVKKPEASQTQMAEQIKTVEEELYSQQEEIKKFQVTVIHDATLPKPKLDEVGRLILEALTPYAVKKDDILFRAANYHVPDKDWRDDLKEPKVYLPLLYAFLLLLLLWFLFGPFSRFLRQYTEALAAKPAAEVNVESNIESPEEGAGKGGGPEESKLDILLGRKPPEPPPDADEEEDMKKLEPFSYINEENIKRLQNLFLLRREEPWLIAVVLSYLKPDFARQVLSGLPVGLQTKVALEALKVRQVTREQIMAIDAEVKENIDFVVGGVERLIHLIEESDPATRNNILESLQNEKPVVYEYVRKSILLFDDIAGFPDREMQTVVRELKTETMSRALQGASPEVVNKFYKNMSAGAASLLKESMEYQKELTAAQVEEERTKIVDQIKVLEKQGKITLRKGDEKDTFQEVLATDEGGARKSASSDPPAPAAEPARPEPNPEEGRRCFDAGVEQHTAGNMDEAVRFFRQAIEYDPELWDAYQYLGQGLYQTGRTAEAVMYYERYLEHHPDPDLQSWVDGFKTQLRA